MEAHEPGRAFDPHARLVGEEPGGEQVRVARGRDRVERREDRRELLRPLGADPLLSTFKEVHLFFPVPESPPASPKEATHHVGYSARVMPEADAPSVDCTLAVRYAETDAQRVVYHGNYVVWFEVGPHEYCERAGYPYARMEAEGVYIGRATCARATASRRATATR